jgi:EmrB/QacA subfamily drug resistance transporter
MPTHADDENTPKTSTKKLEKPSTDSVVETPFQWFTLLTLCLAIAIIVIDGTVLNVSISAIVKDLNTDVKAITWAQTLYSLVLATLGIFGGRLGDLFGRRRAFVVGAIIFGIGSLMTALAPNIGILLLGWSVVEGIGAALMTPASSALIVSNFAPKDRGKAFGMYGATAGIASAIGPILGGFLTTNASWRWAFGINLVVVLALCLGARKLKEYSENSKKPDFDPIGFVLSGAGLGILTYGAIESSKYGWGMAKKPFEIFGSSYDLPGNLSGSLYCSVVGLLLIIGYILWELQYEKNGHEPLVSMKLFRNRYFSSGLLTTSILFASFTGLIAFGAGLFFQGVLELDAFHSGLGTAPLSLGVFIMAPLSAKIAKKITPRVTLQIGLILAGISGYLLYNTFSLSATVWSFAPTLLLFGAGFGMVASQITNITLATIPNNQAGSASGINGALRDVARTMGTAFIGAAFLSVTAASIISGIDQNNTIPVQTKTAITQSIDNGDSSFGFNTTDADKRDVEFNQKISSLPTQAQEQAKSQYQNTKNDISKITKLGVIEGNKTAITYTAVFIVICFLASFSIPAGQIKGHHV